MCFVTSCHQSNDLDFHRNVSSKLHFFKTSKMYSLRHSCRRLTQILNNLQRLQPLAENHCCRAVTIKPVLCQIHTSPVTYGLDEFFDEEILPEQKVIVGRPWRLEELRIKSNSDLHKLWYVLLKERNQIMTMEAMFYNQNESMPNPERLDKVEESMENLLEVVKERNDAFELFEFGETSNPKTYTVRNAVGIPYQRTATQHYVPKHVNERFNKLHSKHEPWMDKHLARYEEKLRVKHKQQYKKLKQKKKSLVEEFELSQEEVNELVKIETEDPLNEYLKMTEELNDVKTRGR